MSPPAQQSDLPIISTRAADKIMELMPADAPVRPWLRIGVRETPDGIGFTFGFDDERADDDTEVDFGTIALLVDPTTREELRNAEIDYVDGEAGSHFVIRQAGP